MTRLSAALSAAFGKLRNSIAEYLDAIDELADEGGDDELIAKAPAELRTLTGLVRTLLAEHRPDSLGCCATCPRVGAGWQYSKAVWPCPVIQTVYRFLDPEQRTERLAADQR